MPKPRTREQLQADTRRQVISAAEEMFLTSGYHNTTVAKIAYQAGRTQGAIYANFNSKEALCLDLLRTHFQARLSTFGQNMMNAASMAAKVDVLVEQWRQLCAESEWTALAGEFGLAMSRNGEIAERLRETVETLRSGVRTVVIAQAIDEGVAIADYDDVDLALMQIASECLGLLTQQRFGLIDTEQSVKFFIRSVSVWFAAFGYELGTDAA